MAFHVTFTYEGKTYPLGSLKVRDIEALEDLLATTTYDANGRVTGKQPLPYVEHRVLTTMRHKLAYMAVFLGRDYPEEKVAEILDGVDLDAIGSMWDIVEDDLPNEYEDGLPLAEAATSTDT